MNKTKTAQTTNEYIIQNISLDKKFYREYVIEQVQECDNYNNYDYVADLEKTYETDEQSMIDFIEKYEIMSFYDFMNMYMYIFDEQISDYFSMIFRLQNNNKTLHDEMYEDFKSIQGEDYSDNRDDFVNYILSQKETILEKYNNCLKSYNYENKKIIQILKDYIY